MNHNTQLLKQYLERPNIGNRRAAPRFNTSDIPVFKSISLVRGPKVKLINISRHGVLMESSERISPGSGISLRIVTSESVHTIKGKMVRYKTISVNGKATGYQIVIAFDEDFTVLPEGLDDFMNF